MPYRIITISRAPYSGARHIARLVAAKLNLAYYDKELITLAARESGLSEEAIAASETQRSSSLLYSLSTLGSQLPLADQVYLVQSNVIKQVAEEGPCVIVGRCGAYVLSSRKDVLNVFLYGSEDLRVAQGQAEGLLPADKAAALSALHKADRKKADYYLYYTQNRWGQAQNYDLCLNAGLGADLCAQLIEEAYTKG